VHWVSTTSGSAAQPTRKTSCAPLDRHPRQVRERNDVRHLDMLAFALGRIERSAIEKVLAQPRAA